MYSRKFLNKLTWNYINFGEQSSKSSRNKKNSRLAASTKLLAWFASTSGFIACNRLNYSEELFDKFLEYIVGILM